ncbi:MAG TPA: alpha/beta hydrolase [Leptolyngbyaceae cyanobacterium M65_K2018_010]|nr:alpha/beta hydrolase [Leptolyngbyaceae cyanobacterium M65_K2018_010]
MPTANHDPLRRRPGLPRSPRGWAYALLAWLASLSALASTQVKSWAAEQIWLDYSLLSLSIPVDALERFATQGEVDAALVPFLRRLTPERQEELKTALTKTRSAKAFPLSQFLYSPMGARSINFVGEFMQTDARLNGGLALRSALIMAAADDGEVSALEVMQKFPSQTIQLDLGKILTLVRQAEAEVDETEALINAVAAQSAADAASPPAFDLAALPNLFQPGPYPTRRIDFTLVDASRNNRTYPVILFIPENLAAVSGSLPIVVISHGLGASQNNFLDAGIIASYGFAVAIPEHIGSDDVQKQALFEGLSNQLFKVSEFIDRPLDITFLLDQLERQNATQYQGKLNLNQVAVVGHSFGGYTALALAGATIDFDRLAQTCTPAENILLDAAELLECRALELLDEPQVIQRLGVDGVRDPRVRLVLTYAPVSNFLGPSGIRRIQIPTVISAGGFDIVAPAVPEQVDAFSWLTTQEKYFYLFENTSHTAGLTRMLDTMFHVDRHYDQSIQEEQVLNRDLTKALIVAFAKVYLEGDSAYQPFLRSAYVEAVSQSPFKRYLVRELPEPWRSELFD